MDGLAALEAKAPVRGHGEVEDPGQGHATLIGNQVHDGNIKVLGGQTAEQSFVLENHLAMNMSDTVEIGW